MSYNEVATKGMAKSAIRLPTERKAIEWLMRVTEVVIGREGMQWILYR